MSDLATLDPALLDRLNAVELVLRQRLNAEHNGSLVVKEDSPLHTAIAAAFDIGKSVQEVARFISVDIPLAIPTGAEFLANFGTPIGNEIALPRAWHDRAHVGTRLLTVPHEFEHLLQDDVGVDAGLWPRSTSHTVLGLAGLVAKTDDGQEYVGKIEGDGYAVTEFVRLYFTGRPRPEEEIVESLRRHYNLAGFGTDVAAAVLRSHYRTMRRGGVPNCWAARIAHEVFEEHVRDLKGTLATL